MEKKMLAMFLVLLACGITQAGVINNCYSNNQDLKEATFCADQKIAEYVLALEQRIVKLEQNKLGICKIEKIPGFKVMLYLDQQIIQTFPSIQYKTWEQLVTAATTAGEKLEKSGRCTFIK